MTTKSQIITTDKPQRAEVTGPHKIEVKSVKTFEGQEGQGFNATLYIDGVRVGRVHDWAMGGPLEFHIAEKHQELYEKATLWASSLDYQEAGGDYALTLMKDLDWLVNDAVEDYLSMQQMRKWMKTDVVVFMPSKKTYKLFKITAKHPEELIINQIKKELLPKHPTARLLNDLTEREILDIILPGVDHRGVA